MAGLSWHFVPVPPSSADSFKTSLLGRLPAALLAPSACFPKCPIPRNSLHHRCRWQLPNSRNTAVEERPGDSHPLTCGPEELGSSLGDLTRAQLWRHIPYSDNCVSGCS